MYPSPYFLNEKDVFSLLVASNLQLDRLQQNGEAGGEIAADYETVPLITRPGYIRFEPLGKSEAPYIHKYTHARPPPFRTHTSFCLCRVCPKIPLNVFGLM